MRTPLAEAMARVGDRWTLPVVDALLDGPRRFSELAEAVDGIAPNILTQRLRDLERDALVVARPYSHRPRRVTYELTEDGRDLATAVRALAEWGARHGGGAEPARHAACGTPLEVRWFCPTCQEAVEAADEDLHFA
ncbi:MAG TPA: helix-turn-helix domain-containing protein [Gaiellales bacterium]|jgi:DNA-binding HxlR family transcriptional regulator|nr:helix-turn-helix domain-containing protein [Gaiellales bacterium]